MAAAAILVCAAMISMPGKSYRGALPALTEEQSDLAERLRGHVETLAGDIGERNTERYGALAEAAAYVEGKLSVGGREVRRVGYDIEGRLYDDLAITIDGSDSSAGDVVIGAHYDSAIGSPGANDNGSGVAALIELAARRGDARPRRTIHFVAFVNEEPPHFNDGTMGSQVYARECRRRGRDVAAMMSLETIGYYSDREGSQLYPFPVGLFYPSTGDFVGFVGNFASRALVRRAVGLFRGAAPFPSEGAALPSVVPGVGWSDHRSFWEQGYPALMVTDTAPFRYPHYHTRRDTPDKVDYERLARVVSGLEHVITGLASEGR